MGRGPDDQELVRMLSELAARVQRGRTADSILAIAGEGLVALGMRFVAFEIDGDDLVLRHVATAEARLAAIESLVGSPLQRTPRLRAPIAVCDPASIVLARRENVHKTDLDLFDRFLRASTGHDLTPLENVPATASIANGVVAPIFVRDEPWGILTVFSTSFRAEDAAAVALFATHVGSAIEVAEFIGELSRTQRELLERERLAAIGRLAATVAHEVRNPIAVITNVTTALRRGVSPDETQELHAILEEEASRLGAIVNDLLDFARPPLLRTQSASLAAVVEDVAHAAAARPEARGIDVRIELSPDVPNVSVDPRLVRQALFNLAVNGLQAMLESTKRRTLTLRTRTTHDGDRAFACIDVADTGHGIAASDGARLFEPFFTTRETGTGLGLPLVKRVVDAHAGDIAFASDASGTTFTMRVPLSLSA